MAVTLELAISAIRSGRTEEGRQLLNLLIQENPNNDKAWLWMSSVVNTDEQRARCLYHVLAIEPNSEIARRGLNVLGIVVSDSRPVKIPRDSRPIEIPKPTPPDQERRPFLIDPQVIAAELPFTPVTAPFAETVEASPSVLSIDVEHEAASQNEKVVSQENESQPHSVQPESPQNSSRPVLVTASTQTKVMDTQPLPDQSYQNPSQPIPVASPHQAQGVTSQPQSDPTQFQSATQVQTFTPPNTASPPGSNIQSPLHPSQPLPANQQPVSQPQQAPAYPMPPQQVASHSNATMGMPPQQPLPPQNPSQPAPPIHANTTMGMPLPAYNQQPQHPSEPVPISYSSGNMGMMPYGQPQMPPQPHQGSVPHSISTMMMPALPELEARARLAASQPMPPANPNFAYQPGMVGDPMLNAYGSMYGASEKTRENEGDGVNIMAVIIFGTLSITALGGLGMLILLVFTTPPA